MTWNIWHDQIMSFSTNLIRHTKLWGNWFLHISPFLHLNSYTTRKMNWNFKKQSMWTVIKVKVITGGEVLALNLSVQCKQFAGTKLNDSFLLLSCFKNVSGWGSSSPTNYLPNQVEVEWSVPIGPYITD